MGFDLDLGLDVYTWFPVAAAGEGQFVRVDRIHRQQAVEQAQVIVGVGVIVGVCQRAHALW